MRGMFTDSDRSCPRCGRTLQLGHWQDGSSTYLLCTGRACAQRYSRRLTRVGCWGTAWRHPEEIEAVRRTHDRVCDCKSAQRARESQVAS